MQSHVSLTSALVGTECSVSRPWRLTPGNGPPIPTGYEAVWAPGAGLDEMEKWKLLILLGLDLRPLGCPACSQSLYRLCRQLQKKKSY
jgi:hypothetical protein